MHKNITIYWSSDTKVGLKSVNIPKSILMLFCVLFIGFIIYSTTVLCSILKKPSYVALENMILEQSSKIESLNKQIQTFAERINSIKLKLISLNNLEKDIRIIANIEKEDHASLMFGIGGTMPTDDVQLKDTSNTLLREMHEQLEQLDIVSVKKEDDFKNLLSALEEKRNILASTPSIAPVKNGWVTSKFGYRKSPFTGEKEFHKGYDIAARKGEPIIATADGVVSFNDKKGLLGNLVTINHGYGMVTKYGHLSESLKKKGDRVKRGEIIAKVGNTGRSTGPHVHYEVRLNGIAVNPKRYMID